MLQMKQSFVPVSINPQQTFAIKCERYVDPSLAWTLGLFFFKFSPIENSKHYCELFLGYKHLLLSISQVLFQQAAFDTEN